MLSYLVWLFSYFFLAVYIAKSIRHILDVILIPKVIYKYIVVGLKKKPSVFGQAYRNRLTPIVGRVAQWKKKFNQCTAWFWFWDVKETQNFYSVYAKKSVAIMEIAPGDLTHIVNLAIFERNFWLCTTSPPLWLKISFHFWQFWVPFISQNYNQAGEIVELFFPLS